MAEVFVLEDYLDQEGYDEFAKWAKANGKSIPQYDKNLINNTDFKVWIRSRTANIPKPQLTTGLYDLDAYWQEVNNDVKKSNSDPYLRDMALYNAYRDIDKAKRGLIPANSLADYEKTGAEWYKTWLSTLKREGEDYGSVIKYNGNYFDTTRGVRVPNELALQEIKKYQQKQSTEDDYKRQVLFNQERQHADTLWLNQAKLAEDKRQFDVANALKVQWQPTYENMGEQLAKGFEAGRQQVLSSLSKSPKDWIQYWMAQRQPNVWAQPASVAFNRGYDVRQASEDLSRPDQSNEWYSQAVDRLNTAKERQVLAMQGQNNAPVGTYPGAGNTIPDYYVDTPIQLTKWVPGINARFAVGSYSPTYENGQPNPYVMPAVAPLDYQTWVKTPPSIQQGVLGYAETRGQSSADLIADMEQREKDRLENERLMRTTYPSSREGWIPRRT